MSVTDLCLLALRLVVGLTFAAHGAQKAFGWWSGPGPDRWRGAVEAMGFAPSGFFGRVSTAIELVGGSLLALGLLTPLAVIALIAQVVVIIARAHWPRGFFNSVGGYEYPLLLGVVVAVVGLLGPGLVSLDEVLGVHLDVRAGVIALVAGFVVGAVTAAVPRLLRDHRFTRGGLRRT
jgi:putative oxidoreductase